MENCIFCQIVGGSLPAYIVYQNDLFLAFMDIYPRVKGHTLVIPKKHYRWVNDVVEFGAYWETARVVAMKIQKALKAKFISYLTFGTDVPHAHIHLLPEAGGVNLGAVIPTSKQEIASLADRIIRAV